MRLRITTVGVCLAIACSVSAQELKPRLIETAANHGNVYVVDAAKQEFFGPLMRIDASSLTIRTAMGDIPIALQNVRAIYRPGDSIFTGGTLIGLGIGVVTGIVGASTTRSYPCLDSQGRVKSCGGDAAVVASSVIGWTAMGAIFDALHKGRTRLYSGHPTPALRVNPAITNTRASIHGTLTWR